MTQGLQNAPGWFQWVMEDVLRGDPKARALLVSILLDDVATVHDKLPANLRDAAEVILRLTRAGAMIGPAKCYLGIEEGRHLGDWWTSGGQFRPPPARTAALLELTHEQLAGMGRSKVYGMIGYWREYVPDFAARTRRLKAMLSSDATPWT